MFQYVARYRGTPRVFVARPSYTPTTSRYFSIVPRRQLKEDGNRSPEELEKLKQEQLRKQKQGQGEWHEGLASAGEAGIAADKQKVSDHDKHMEDLQKETAAKVEKDHPEGKA